MSEFEKFKRRFVKVGYRFKTYKKDFGERLIGTWDRGFLRANNRILVYHFSKKKPSVTDFGEFVKDFEDFIDRFGDDYDIEGAHFVTYGEYDKRAFKLILERLNKKIRKGINIVKLREEKPKIAKVKPVAKKKVIPKTPELKRIVSKIKRFTPPKKPRGERELDNMLVSYLSAFYDVITKQTYERARIDAQIGKIGIEIKYEPSAGEFDRLYGQVEKYLRHLDYVIAIIGYEISRENTRYFKKRMKERGWLNDRVFVISIP